MESRDTIITDVIMKLYLYADWTKAIHYSTDSNHIHELCDTVRDDIVSFADSLAEQFYGNGGKPAISDFSIDGAINKTSDLGKMCQSVIDMVKEVRDASPDNMNGWFIQSLTDDFVGTMNKDIFLSRLR